MTVPAPLGEVTDADLARARRAVVARALAEDLGDVGDVTTAATVPVAASGSAELVARADGVLAGLACLDEVFAQVDSRVEVLSSRGELTRRARRVRCGSSSVSETGMSSMRTSRLAASSATRSGRTTGR